jgi:hypothetical protein
LTRCLTDCVSLRIHGDEGDGLIDDFVGTSSANILK